MTKWCLFFMNIIAKAHEKGIVAWLLPSFSMTSYNAINTYMIAQKEMFMTQSANFW